MTHRTIDFRDYCSNPRTSALRCVVLAGRLANTAPTDASPQEREALAEVMALAERVMETRNDRDRLRQARVRPLLAAHVGDWIALDEALAAKARISLACEARKRAATVRAALFPRGLGFRNVRADAVWVVGGEWLERTERADLAGTIDALVGPEHLAAIRASRKPLARALGLAEDSPPRPSRTGVAQAVERFSRAVGRYTRVLVASCDEHDPVSLARFRHAVVPLDAHRAKTRGRRGDTESDATDPADGAAAPPALEPNVVVGSTADVHA